MKLEKIAHSYTRGVLILANVVLLFIALNLLAYGLLKIDKLYANRSPVVDKYGNDKLASVYAGMEPAELQRLLSETWSRPNMEYEPYTQFREREFEGKYVTINKHGFRHIKDQGPWPLNPRAINIFVFGGSTTFGYGVTNEQTIPSYLQEALRKETRKPVNVYNFGRGFYFSGQERALFEQLLLAGHRPDIVVFIDGLNDFSYPKGEPKFTPNFRRQLDGRIVWERTLNRLPVMRLVRKLTHSDNRPVDDLANNDPEAARAVIEHYEANRKLIQAVASAYGVNPLFVWQPVPGYQPGGKNANPFIGKDELSYPYQYAYPDMLARSKKFEGNDFFWAADLQAGEEKLLYVDRVHYSSYFSQKIARAIARYLLDTPDYSVKFL